MKNFVKTVVISTILIVAFSMTLSAQGNGTENYDKAKKEIEQRFGTFPSFFDALPKYALSGAWQAFKELQAPGNIDSKNRELIGLAVASQVPCNYCVYVHTELAKASGATDEEIKEAVAFSAMVRHWSSMLYGAQVDFKAFSSGNFDKYTVFPEYANSGARQAYDELHGSGSISKKNRELIGLAVSSQIPCSYCVMSHVSRLKGSGTTDEEIKEAVAYAALVRHWSTIFSGAQLDLKKFKKEFDGTLKYWFAQANAKK